MRFSRAFRVAAQVAAASRSISRDDLSVPDRQPEEIRLLARNNEVMSTKRTDASGHVLFEPGLVRAIIQRSVPASFVPRNRM